VKLRNVLWGADRVGLAIPRNESVDISPGFGCFFRVRLTKVDDAESIQSMRPLPPFDFKSDLFTAARSDRPNALKMDSQIWWLFLPAS
jgi:hypothetical protein